MGRQAAGKGRGRGRARARSTVFEIASVCPLASGPPRERDPSTWTRRRWRYPRATSTESTTRPRRARYPRASPCSEARRGRDARAPSRCSAGRSDARGDCVHSDRRIAPDETLQDERAEQVEKCVRSSRCADDPTRAFLRLGFSHTSRPSLSLATPSLILRLLRLLRLRLRAQAFPSPFFDASVESLGVQAHDARRQRLVEFPAVHAKFHDVIARA